MFLFVQCDEQGKKLGWKPKDCINSRLPIIKANLRKDEAVHNAHYARPFS